MKQSWLFIGIGLGIIGIAFVIFSMEQNEPVTSTEDSPTTPILEQRKAEFRDQVAKIQVNNHDAKKIVSDCWYDENCLMDEMQVYSKQNDPQTIMNTIGDITEIYQQAGLDCHVLAHHLGKYLYGSTGNLTLSLNNANKKCGGAIYHGVMENYFKTEIFFDKQLPEDFEANSICENAVGYPYSEVQIQCSHGIGHGLAIAYDYDVFSAVKRCDEFENEVNQRFCKNGVFMANMIEIIKNDGGVFDEEDLLYPCNKLEEAYSGDCYQYQGTYILLKNELSLADSFAVCDTIKSEDDIRDCYYSIGMNMAVTFYNQMEDLPNTCNKGNPEFQNSCIVGIVYMIANELRTQKAFEFCKVVQEKFKADCYDTLGKWIHTIHSTDEEIETSCSKAENSKSYEICVNADPKNFALI